MRKILSLLSSLVLAAVMLVGVAPAAEAATYTRETIRTFDNIYHSDDYRVRYRTNYTQGSGTIINWMQICVIQAASFLNASPKIYDIDLYIYNSSTGVYERTYLNASSGSSTCRTWYPNEWVASLNVQTSFWATLNTAQAPDIRGSSAHSL